MSVENIQTPKKNYRLLGAPLLLLMLLLAGGWMVSLAHAGSRPSSPAATVRCVNRAGGDTGAPCANPTAYANVDDAVAAANAGDEIRIVSSQGAFTHSVSINIPLTLSGGYSGEPTQWGAPTCLDASCTILDGENLRTILIVQANVAVTLDAINLYRGSVSNGGTINAGPHGFRLQSSTSASINGHFNATLPGYILLLDGIEHAQPGTNFTGDGYLLVTQNGALELGGNTSVTNLQEYFGASRSGIISGTGTLTVSHIFKWQAGSMMGGGTTIIQPGATMTVGPLDTGGGNVVVLDNWTLNNQGTTIWNNGTYNLMLRNGSHFNNIGLFLTVLDSPFQLDNDTTIPGTFNNSGTYRVPVGGGKAQILIYSDFVIFDNDSIFDIPGPDDFLHIVTGIINMNDGSSVTGEGNAMVGTSSGTWNITGTVYAPNVILNAWNNNNGIIGTGALYITGTLDWQNGRMGGTGVTTLLPGAVVRIHEFARLDGRTFNNQGTATQNSTENFNIINGGTFNNYGTYTADGCAFAAETGTGTFNNYGTFTKQSGTGCLVGTGITFVNSGTLNILGGFMWFQNNALLRQTSGVTNVAALLKSNGQTIALEGGVLKGTNTIQGNVNNTGAEVSPGASTSSTGILTIDGNYTQGAGGVLDISLGGTTAGTGYDQLNVTGAATLAGTLNTADVNGFVHQVGNQFQAITYGSHTGSISTFHGGEYTPTYNPTNLTLEVSANAACPGFTDVQAGSTFYPYVSCLVNRGVISGYSDCTFRPNSSVTRGQLSKITALAAGYNDTPGAQRFEDIPVGSTFYTYIQQLASRNIINGYACGGAGEPCGNGNLPYFRPNSPVTRSQTSKIVAIAAELPAPPPGQQTFQDVAVNSTFWTWIESLSTAGAIGGYACGGPGEPCVGPANLNYFRPSNVVTRGQSSKIIANTFFPDCQLRTR